MLQQWRPRWRPVIVPYDTQQGATSVVARRLERVIATPPEEPGFAGPFHTAVEVVGPHALAQSDPFVLLMDDRLAAGAGTRVGGAHPHAGLETVTLVLAGTVRDRDEGELAAGDAVWMTAGRGVIHNESVEAKGDARILQLWIGLPARLRDVEPGYEILLRDDQPVVRKPGVVARLYSGSSNGLRSPTHNHVPVTLIDVLLDPGAHFEQSLLGSDNGFVYMLEGDALVGGTAVAPGQIGWLDRPRSRGESMLSFTAGSAGARFVLYAGAPHGEALVQHGPFVAGSQREVTRMYTSFRSGRFAPLSTLSPRSSF
jgi:quercetin 2,3-dioxygenase